MLKRLPFYIILCGLIGLLNYFVTTNLLFSIVISLIGIVIFTFILDKMVATFLIRERKSKEAILFINNFIITLSINCSILSTFNTIEESFSPQLKNQIRLIDNLEVEEKIKYLEKYFMVSSYDVFLNLLDQYIYNGGDILKISQLLLFDIRQLEEKIENHNQIIIKKMMEFIILWIMIFAIVMIMKFSLADYFVKIASLNYFKYGMAIFFVSFYLNISLFIAHATNLNFIKSNKKIVNENKRKRKNVKVKRKDRKM